MGQGLLEQDLWEEKGDAENNGEEKVRARRGCVSAQSAVKK